MQVQLAQMGAESLQVMVTDTDTRAVLPRDPQCDILCSDRFFMGTCALTQIDCTCYGPECFGECMQDLTGTCGPNDEFSCVDMTGCDDSCECELVSGIIQDKVGNDRGITGDSRFMEPDPPDPHGIFSCIAAVGTSGTGGERPLGSMLAALADSNNPDGGCNAGFLRDLNPPPWIDELRAPRPPPRKPSSSLA
ncbi:hypothetical protein PPSIR1_38549 [Plesiocystis pacifica SIR-1]|uniref:Uncharacterized protein n=1 Tax=Plesiocystis pacifica SIR-1 TaxID=391625 RepID=A6G8N3_9BACT|nr:hypothetical protein [Plesiocystis pacifica]EDM77810.1 hypothetical protein PPSIR1_38549 [Plesiocystis pacifica SIR-1]